MSYLTVSFQGRFGNQVMQYLFARAWAESQARELRTKPWIGERVFKIQHARPDPDAIRRVNEVEMTFEDGAPRLFSNEPLEFRGYAQMQRCMIYTKRQAQDWLELRDELIPACECNIPSSAYKLVAHRRVGDYIGYGYPVVSHQSYLGACKEFGLDSIRLHICKEEDPFPHYNLPEDMSWLVDFYLMMHAKTLLRGNSSFSWVAALLGRGLALSPVIDGLEGGREHDVRFVAGNHPKFANLDFITDLRVSP